MTEQETTETTEETAELEEVDETTEEEEPEPETFPLEYVQKLRQEAADARVKAKRVDDLAQRLHIALVTATGRLADPSDLPYDEAQLEDADALTATIDALLERKPHLAARKPRGNVGQGETSVGSPVVDLGSLLRMRA